ncbi:MAG: hypothetical protein ACO2PP_06735 [Thermocrinis sp.]|jgi:cell division septum initiation protein DivIVA|uniref:hypothetical protein n=1 Tax=Thermocrinis sp. TaxID=2024383 RepID=UPI003C05BFCF
MPKVDILLDILIDKIEKRLDTTERQLSERINGLEKRMDDIERGLKVLADKVESLEIKKVPRVSVVLTPQSSQLLIQLLEKLQEKEKEATPEKSA